MLIRSDAIQLRMHKSARHSIPREVSCERALLMCVYCFPWPALSVLLRVLLLLLLLMCHVRGNDIHVDRIFVVETLFLSSCCCCCRSIIGLHCKICACVKLIDFQLAAHHVLWLTKMHACGYVIRHNFCHIFVFLWLEFDTTDL